MRFWLKIKPWLRGWRLVGLIVLILIISSIANGIYKSKHDTSGILTDTVKKQDLKQTVLATGVVTSSTNLNLSFRTSGLVRSVSTTIGSKVSAGQVLATLDQKDQAAALTSARGTLASAQANFDKVLSGASSEDVAVAQASVNAASASLDQTKSQQQVLVSNAYSAMLNAGLAAIASPGNSSAGTIAVSGTYTGQVQGQYKVTVYQTGGGLNFQSSGLESSSAAIVSGISTALGTKGLFLTFGNGIFNSGDTWTISVPNTQSSSYLSASNAYQAALQTQISATTAAQSALDQAQATLNLKKAQARPADLEAARAQILSAQGQVQSANASLENTIIRAPIAGTITRVDIKVGQTLTAQAEALVLQNVDELHLEADVSEANVTQIQAGQSVDVTFDALSPDQHYTATVNSLDLSSTVVSGVVNYKLTASLDKTDNVKPGMTANMTILAGSKAGALSVPSRAIISKDGKKFVRVVTDSKTKTYREQEVKTGFEADGGLVEITSGLDQGMEIITLLK